MTEDALLRARGALVWNSEALELWRPLGDLWIVVTEWRPVWFATDLSPGRYRVSWVEGIVLYNPTWFSLSDNIQILTSVASVAENVGRIPWPAMQRFYNLAGATSAAQGQMVEFEHVGGPIGMAVNDPIYTDNSGGARFRLWRL